MRLLFLATAACLLAAATHDAPAAAAGAEYAIRWDSSEGGPDTFDAIASALRLAAGKKQTFSVRYFTVTAQDGSGPAPNAIARERDFKGRTQSTYKLRGSAPLADNEALARWQCPLAGRKTQAKDEVDIAWTADGPLPPKYSRSCDAGGRLADLLPARYQPTPSGCSSAFDRVHAGPFKIEHWQLAGGRRVFEVSASLAGTAADLDAFRTRVVRPLLDRGVKPLPESKTELGSGC
jgi:hypothetical protein